VRRETERKPRVANSEGEVRGKQARAREREQKGQDITRMKRTQEKTHYNQTDDYLTLYRWSLFERWLVMVTTFSSLLPSSHCISRSLSFAQHATSGLSSRAALLTLLAPTPFFSLFFLSSLCKKDQQRRHTMKQQPIFLHHHYQNSTSMQHVHLNRAKYAHVGVLYTSYIYIYIYLSYSFFFLSVFTKKKSQGQK
jgi:hypothetical protein